MGRPTQQLGIKLIIVIVGLWLAKIGIPWLKQSKIYSLIQKFVRAAEKKANAGSIQKSYKKTFVILLLEACGIEVTEEVDAMIESAVEELDEITAAALTQLTEPTVVAAEGAAENDTDDGDGEQDE